MAMPKMRKIKYELTDEVKDHLYKIGREIVLNEVEETDQPEEIDLIEQGIVSWTRNLLKRETDELKILEKFYKKIQPVYDFYYQFTKCKKGCGNCCKIHVSTSPIEIAFIEKKTNINHRERFRDSIQWHEYVPDQKECPFLKDNCCSIYDSRPYACRNYLIFPDEAPCPTSLGKDIKIPLFESPNISFAFHLISQRYNKRNNLPDLIIDFKKYFR